MVDLCGKLHKAVEASVGVQPRSARSVLANVCHSNVTSQHCLTKGLLSEAMLQNLWQGSYA